MDAPELLSAITGQAHRVGLRFEGDLSQQMLEDVTGEPGAMPLLQHAAWILWQRRHGRWLRAEEYRAFGGVKQAIASTAEEVYAQCTESERKRMRDIFLRLTRLDDAPTGLHRDTRRRVAMRDLIPAGNESNLTLRLLDKLANSRLLVKTETEVEVAHETLIQHWDRLKDWLENDRNTLIIYQHLRQRASEWAQGGHIPDLLYPPSRLKQIDNLQKSGYLLNANETAFVTASQARRKSLILQKYALWISALVLAGIVLVAFPLRLAYYAVLRQQVLKESPMVELKGGNIKFGTDDPNRFSDEPVLETRYVETFFLETTEVTNAKYRVCVKVGICKEPKDTAHYDLASYNDHPVVQVTLDQAIAYCAWLGRRLPDTYEWERAARGLAEESRLWPWGDSPPSRENANIILPLGSNQWYAPKDTQPVGFLKPGKTSEGVFDLVGNVWEWTSTQISEGVYVQRGGSWNSTMERVTKIKTIDAQHQLSPDQAVGFRCAQ
jgi:formylglycine-generating enzyme required for sulfatase activity